MEPKLADFGLSRIFTRSHTHVTENIKGTRKYMPPEFLAKQIISPKNDVFSLGVVMLEIMTRSLGQSSYIEMDEVTQFKEVHTDWKNVIEATSEYPSEELHQVQTCINTAICCVEPDRNKRPTIEEVLSILNKTENHIPKRQVDNISPNSPMAKRLKIDSAKKKQRLKKRAAQVDSITNEHNHFDCMSSDSFNIHLYQVSDRETTSTVQQKIIFGRTEDKKIILSTLSKSMTEELRILPIYGMGGIGKTTLSQLIINDTQFHEYSQVWVYVSEKLDLNGIGNSIISQLSKDIHHVAIADMQITLNRLRELLGGKGILIVLDDLWEQDPRKLDKLKDMLRLGLGSKVIIVTTRYEATARKIRNTMMPYKLENLTDDMCWNIIKHKSGYKSRVDRKQLKQIGQAIANSCGGVAIAAQSLGYTLYEKSSNEWVSVRDNCNISTSVGPSARNHEVLLSLMLSYKHMPECLKLCFSYCAIFPKGHKIVKYDLIHQWIALGFPAKKGGSATFGLTEQSSLFDYMQLCEQYVTSLLGMCFLEYSKTPSSDGKENKVVTLFTMHDLVHDLARVILSDEVNEKGTLVGSTCRYALLTDCSKQLQSTSPTNIRALHFVDCGKIKLHRDAFSSAKCLLVLDLNDCIIKSLPNSIGRLKHLRFLRAPQIRNTIPDSITKLSELTYLNLSGSRGIYKLPDSIGDMKGLMHLDLSGCDGIYELTVSFTELKQLVHLDLSECVVMSISEIFGGFIELQYLNLLYADKYNEELYFTPNRGGLAKVISNLMKLRYLNLSGCMESMDLSENQTSSLLGSICTLPDLEHLDLSYNQEIFSIPESIGNLRKLHTLDLSGCDELEELPVNSMVDMVSMKVLNVSQFATLDESTLSRFNFAPLPNFVVHASLEKRSSNIILLRPVNPEELKIYRLENVMSAEEAKGIKLKEKEKIKELSFEWTGGAKRFLDDDEVLEELVPPSSVQVLRITSYGGLSFPDWLMGMWKYLPNLSSIYLRGFPKCKNLPPLGQLPNLNRLYIYNMEGLEEWDTAYPSGEEGANGLMFPKLEALWIEQCAKLRLKSCPPRATLHLHIADCDNMLATWGESSLDNAASSSSQITHLSVEDSKVPMYDWRLLHHIPALYSLTIKDCSDLTTSHKIIQQLSSLQSLSLQRLGCKGQLELPTWLFELTSLRWLNICHPELAKLNESTRQLTQLLALNLSGCRSLTSLPQWLGELTSLQKLELRYCKGIRSLPDSIQQLTRLVHLDMCDCPALTEWHKSSEQNEMKIARIRNVIPWLWRSDGRALFYARRFPIVAQIVDGDRPQALGEREGPKEVVEEIVDHEMVIDDATADAPTDHPMAVTSLLAEPGDTLVLKGNPGTNMLCDGVHISPVDPEDVAIISKKTRSLLELWPWEKDQEAALFSEASASSPPVFGFDLNSPWF